MKKILLATFVVSTTANASLCDERFMFALKIMRQYINGESGHVMLSQASEDNALANIVDDAFNFEVPRDTTDKLEIINQFSIKYFEECEIGEPV